MLSLVGCFGLHAIGLSFLGGGVDKGESNYFSSLARMQHAARGQSTIFLLGSSRTGRLPDRRSAPDEFPEVANLGCDGGSALVALRAIDEGSLPCPPVLIIEGNTLVHDLEQRGQLVATGIRSPWFQAGVHWGQLRADARPASLLYSVMRDRKFRAFDKADHSFVPSHLKPRVETEERDLPPAADGLVDELSGITQRLRDRGARLLLVMLPPASNRESLNAGIPLEWSRRSGIPCLDLGQTMAESEWTYTDGIHLSPASANLAIDLILGEIDEAS